jgi:hypothetical protein
VRREGDGAVEGMKGICVVAGMEGFEEQLERILRGVVTGVLQDFALTGFSWSDYPCF